MSASSRSGYVHVVVLTGAGVSAGSGLATFRDAGGLWEGVPPEQVATPEAWAADPDRVWRFYQMRRARLLEVEPNVGHRALAKLERRLAVAGAGFLLVTQNVDDLHERAGSQSPLHVHGELGVLACEACGARIRDLVHVGAEPLPCASCGYERLRPGVVWFGEVPHGLDRIADELERCTHFLALGTSGVVYPAAGFLQLARTRGAKTWVQALERPANGDARDEFVAGRSEEVLPALLERVARECGA